MSEAIKRRITYKHAHPNPLFEEWLKELHEEARQRGSKLETMLKEALESLSKYPLRLESGAECAILKGFKKKLCVFLDMRLDVYKSNLKEEADREALSGQPTSPIDVDIIDAPRLEKYRKKEQNTSSTLIEVPVLESKKSGCHPNQSSSTSTTACRTSNPNPTQEKSINNGINSELHTNDKALPVSRAETTSSSTSYCPNYELTKTATYKSQHSTKSKQECKKYKPKYRSGGFAILVALFEQLKNNPSIKSLTKEQLIEKAQIYSNESFTRPKPESFYTAWANMKGLLEKGLIIKKYENKKKEYFLSTNGFLLAEKLYKEFQIKPSDNDIIFDNVKETVTTQADVNSRSSEVVAPVDKEPNKAIIEMPAGSFDVILLIDKNETGGVTKKNDPTVAQFKKYPDLKHEYRSLKVGDFTWIARNKVNKDEELVLPYVIERKRMDDLGASIKDGRFHEQKFRLKKCGLDNVIYMVENYGTNKHVGLPVQSLKQALANTRVQDKFRVHETNSLTDSVRFLAIMTKRLTIEFMDKTLRGGNCEASGNNLMTFDFFNKSSMKSKRLSVREAFIKMLLQLKGVSVEKALAITNKYNTPRSLIEEYKICNESDGQLLLANLRLGDLNRNVGPNVSKTIYHLFFII